MRRLLEWTTTPPGTQSNSNSSSYKEKFEKLLDYHKKHKAYFVDRSEIKYVREDGFHYMDHVKYAGEEFDHDVVVNMTIGKFTGLADWTISVFKNGNLVLAKSHNGTGYEDLVNSLRDSLVIPPRGSSAYDTLLESANFKKLNKGVNMLEFSNIVGWESSARDWARALFNALEDDSIRILDYYEMPDFCDFVINQHGDILTYRVHPGGQLTIRDSSFADDFKTYENLWN